MSSFPKISIVIPSLNKVEYIEKTLKSVVSQDYSDFEVIIQDGGSTDGTLEIIEKYGRENPKLISWVSKRDRGQAEAVNEGFKKANGEVYAYLNADDVFKKGALKKVAGAFKKNRDALWVAGKGRIINKRGIEITSWVTKYKNLLLDRNKFRLLLTVNYLVQPSVFISKKAFEKYGPFVGWRKSIMEYDLWLKIGEKEMPVVIKDCLSGFRIAEGTASSTLYRQILAKDHQLAARYTKNPFILSLHHLNNLGRIATLRFLEGV
jgi:glycosyltransferase involved in cell wall biosynthesis